MSYSVIDLIEEMEDSGKKHNVKEIFRAVVKSSYPNISISFNDMIFNKKQIHISQRLLDIEKLTTLKTSQSKDHTHNITLPFKPLKQGDVVIVLYDYESNTLTIIDKVVKLDGK